MEGRDNERVSSVLASLKASHGNMRMETLSSKYCLHRCHLSRLIKKILGHSFRDLRTIIRILSMMELVRTTHLSVKEIAARVGIHPDYLCTLFKKVTGMTVKEYRERLPNLKNHITSEESHLPSEDFPSLLLPLVVKKL